VKRLGVALEADRDRFVASMAAISLGRIAGQVDSPLAVRLLERDWARRRPAVREFDLLALALARAPSALDAAASELRDERAAPTTRCAAAIAVGLLADSRGRAALREVLRSDTHPVVRGYTAMAIGMLGDESARDELRAIVQRARSPQAVAYAALGLSLIARHADAEAILQRLAQTDDELVGPNLVHALRLAGDRRLVDELVAIVSNSATPGRRWAISALGYANTSPDLLPRRLALARGFNYLLPCGPLLSYFYAE